MPQLPDLSEGGGFTIEMSLRFDDILAPQTVLNAFGSDNKGFSVQLVPEGTLQLTFGDGKRRTQWYTDPYEVLTQGKLHHVVFIVDGGPNIITVLVDGQLLDGGEHRQYGWTRFPAEMGDISTAVPLTIPADMKGELFCLRVYNRYLRTSEAIANYHAGL